MKYAQYTLATLFLLVMSCTSPKEVYHAETLPENEEVAQSTEEVTAMQAWPEEHSGDTPVKNRDEVRWYAIENADNDAYWSNVDCSKIWVELTLGTSIETGNVRSFLDDHGLSLIHRSSANPALTNYYIFHLENGNRDQVLDMAKAAQSVESILFLEPKSNYSSQFEPNDQYWDQQWGPYVIYADEAWEFTTGGSFNVIAVIDDAVDYTHSDLSDQVQYGWDYGFNDGDPYPDFADQTHGTHVTGTIAATINNGIGVAGMVNDTVYFAKVTDATYDPQFGNFSDAAIIDALYDIAGIQRVGVVNMSLGAPTPSAALEEACNYAWNQGKLLVAASGNDGVGQISFPAAFDACMAVGSIGTDGNSLYLAGYSQYGNQQEVVAPGGDTDTGYGILSTVPGEDYAFFQGTSMAAPHVAGVAGLIQALDPSLSNETVRTILHQSCEDFGDAGWDPIFGYGMVNAYNAMLITSDGGTVSVDEDDTEVFSMYPNPCRDRLIIEQPAEDKYQLLEVFGLEGTLAMQIQLNPLQKVTAVDVSQLSKGIYVVTLSDQDGNRKNKQLVKL